LIFYNSEIIESVVKISIFGCHGFGRRGDQAALLIGSPER